MFSRFRVEAFPCHRGVHYDTGNIYQKILEEYIITPKIWEGYIIKPIILEGYMKSKILKEYI